MQDESSSLLSLSDADSVVTDAAESETADEATGTGVYASLLLLLPDVLVELPPFTG